MQYSSGPSASVFLSQYTVPPLSYHKSLFLVPAMSPQKTVTGFEKQYNLPANSLIFLWLYDEVCNNVFLTRL